MAHPRRPLIRLALLGLLLGLRAAPLAAQPPPPAPEPPALTAFALDESPLWRELRLLPPAKPSVPLAFQGNRRSPPIKFAAADAPLVFGLERADPATGRIERIPMAEVVRPAGATKVLVVFISDPKTGAIRALAIDDGQEAFPLRSVRAFNATSATLLARISDHQGELPPGVSPAWPYRVKSETDLTQVGVFPFALALPGTEGDSRRLYSSHVDAWPLGRTLLFVLPPAPGSGELQIRALVDSPRPPKPAAD